MRLCIIANPNSIHVRRWVEHFAEQHEVHLLAVQPPRTTPAAEVHVHDLTKITNVPKIRYLIWSVAARRIVKQLKPDVVHAFWISAAGWVAAATGYRPFMVSVLGSDLLVQPRRSRIFRSLAKWVLGRADRVTCISKELLAEARRYGVPDAKLELQRLGVDTAVFQPAKDRSEVRRRLGLGDGPIVISIRAIRPIYNPLDIARAIPLIHREIPEASFLVLTYSADQVMLETFRNIIQAAGVGHAVTYVPALGQESDIARHFQSADVAISVSSSDGTPVSVQEVMACGTATVLGDIPAFHDWVTDGKESLLVPLHDPAAQAAAVVRLLKDAPLRKQVSGMALAYVRSNADKSKWMAKAEEIYLTLCQTG